MVLYDAPIVGALVWKRYDCNSGQLVEVSIKCTQEPVPAILIIGAPTCFVQLKRPSQGK